MLGQILGGRRAQATLVDFFAAREWHAIAEQRVQHVATARAGACARALDPIALVVPGVGGELDDAAGAAVQDVPAEVGTGDVEGGGGQVELLPVCVTPSEAGEPLPRSVRARGSQSREGRMGPDLEVRLDAERRERADAGGEANGGLDVVDPVFGASHGIASELAGDVG